MIRKQGSHQLFLCIFFIATAIVGSVAIYWPGLAGTFLLDDYPNLEPIGDGGGVYNINQALKFVFGNGSGPSGRPLSMLSFLANDQYWPASVMSFKFTNLMLHIISGLLIALLSFRLSLKVSKADNLSLWVAILTSLLWLFHPFNVSTTLYVVQRMTQLMTIFLLAGLICYVHGRECFPTAQRKGIILISLGALFFGALSILSKENGALIFIFILAIELTIYREHPRTKQFQIWLLLFVVLPILILSIYFLIRWDELIKAYDFRNFTLYERLLTQPRVLFSYLYNILVPNISDTGLFHDDYLISKGILEPISTLFSIAALIAFFATAIVVRKRFPIFSLAIFWFYTGHILESTFLPLEIYFEHRNYLPMVGILFGISYIVVTKLNELRPQVKTVALCGVLFFQLLLASLTFNLATLWSNTSLMFAVWANNHPASTRAQTHYAAVQVGMGEPEKALDRLYNLYDRTNGLGTLFRILELSCFLKKPMRYDIEDEIQKPYVNAYYDILFPLELIAKVAAKKNCELINMEQMHVVLDTLANFSEIKSNSTTAARVFNLHSDLYISEKNLSGAVDMAGMAFLHQRTVDLKVKQIILLASAGLYEEALKHIAEAKVVDANRKLFQPSRLGELEQLEMIYNSKIRL